MNRHFKLKLGFLRSSILLLMLLLSACAPEVPAQKRFFWPPGTGDPKIEYINFFMTDHDIERGGENWVADAVLGKSQPVLLFKQPLAIASDGHGRVFVCDIVLHQVLVFDLARHQTRTLQAMSRGTQNFRFPANLAVDGDGQVWVVDSLDRKVFVFGADEKLRKIIDLQPLLRPTSLAVDSNRKRLYVVDTDGHQVGIFDYDGTFRQLLGQRGKEEGEFNFPLDIGLDRDGELYVLDSMNARVQIFDPDGHFLRAFGERGTASGSFQLAKGIAVSASGHVYVTDSMAHHFVVFDLQGNYLLTVGGKSDARQRGVVPGGFYLPSGIDVDANDTIWIVDSLNLAFHQYQYLNKTYLQEHPVLPGQTYFPPSIQPDSGGATEGK